MVWGCGCVKLCSFVRTILASLWFFFVSLLLLVICWLVSIMLVKCVFGYWCVLLLFILLFMSVLVDLSVAVVLLLLGLLGLSYLLFVVLYLGCDLLLSLFLL